MDKSNDPMILIVDDIAGNIDLLAEILKDDYQIKVARNGEQALEIVRLNPQIALILLDIMMPGIDGYEVCRRLKEEEKSENIPVIFVTAMDDVADERRGFQLGAVDFLKKPVSAPIVQARVKNHIALHNQNRVLETKVAEKTKLLQNALIQLKESSLETIYRLTQAAEYRDEDTGEHIQRMSHYAAAVARELGASAKTVEQILRAAPMHDIGKIGIPDRILLKPDKLDAEEWEIMKQHTTIGGKILSNSSAGFIRLGEKIALSHHEKWDGSGYPEGLEGKQIPLVGQIVAIADVFDALTTRRPYKKPFSLEVTYDILNESSGSHFNPQVVEAFFTVEEEILAIKDKYKDSAQSYLRKHA